MAHRGRQTADEALIAGLAAGMTVSEAAGRAGIAPRTAWRRLQDDGFRQRLDTARQQTVKAAVDTLSQGSTRAARTLVALLSYRQRASTRLAAARAILELGSRLREAGELEERIAALEECIAQQGQRRRA